MTNFEIWNGYMRSYDMLTQVDGYRRNLMDVAAAARAQAGDRFLDAGSGTGNLSIALKAGGASVVSCDFSPIALAKHRAKDPNAELMELSLENPLPFADESFDGICCASVLFALSENGCRRAVKEFQRVLRPNGRLVITVPAREARLTALVKMHIHSLQSRHKTMTIPLHALISLPTLLSVLWYNYALKSLPDWQGFHYFSEVELRELVDGAGLQNVAVGRTYGDCFFILTASRAASAPVVAIPRREVAA